MKKIFFYSIVSLFILVSIEKVNAQPKKLTGVFAHTCGIVVDSKGNVFVTSRSDKIYKITPAGKAEFFVGGGRGYKDGKGKDVGFYSAEGIAIDASDNLYIADGSRVRKITPDAVVTTIAGSLTAAVKDGDHSVATFLNLENIAIDPSGNIYVTDYSPGKDWHPGQIANSGEYLIRKIAADGQVTTLKDGNNNLLILKYPRGLGCDKEGNLYINASVSHCIKKISPAGVITTFAGQCDKTVYNSVYKEGPVSTAILTNPTGMAIADNGDVYITDSRLHRIIKIANGKVTTAAGSGKFNFSGNPAGAAEPGYSDGKGAAARFNSPWGIAFDRNGNLFIVDASSSNNSYIRKMTSDGTVTTFCKHEWNPKTSQYEEVE